MIVRWFVVDNIIKFRKKHEYNIKCKLMCIVCKKYFAVKAVISATAYTCEKCRKYPNSSSGKKMFLEKTFV